MQKQTVELLITAPGIAELVTRGDLTVADANQIVDDAKQEVSKALGPFTGMSGIAGARYEYSILTHRPWNVVESKPE